ncbi:DUF2690 domain-containing protein [Micromonospora echinofusca]|uniref:DUF2690 domain-containing protein n=1 Tax=Micromonospora echinofusca TaxID=47858 RepID=UPI0037156AAE
MKDRSTVRSKLARLAAAAVMLTTALVGVGAGPAVAAPDSAQKPTATAAVDDGFTKRTLRNPEVVSALADPDQAIFISAGTLATYGCRSLCDYKDPASFRVFYDDCSNCYYKCADDAEDKLKHQDPVISIMIRYSPRCRTAWAKSNYSGNSYVKADSRYLSGSHRTTVTEYVGNYTVMLNDADLQARACVQPSGPYNLYCTGWY